MKPSHSVGRVSLEISLKNLLHNLTSIKQAIHPAQCILVLKADAYGLGIENLLPIVHQANIKEVAVASLQEVKNLRKENKKYPPLNILLLGGVIPFELSELLKLNVTIPINHWEQAILIDRIAEKKKTKHSVCLVVDTGMGRIGVYWEQAWSLMEKILTLKHLVLTQVYTHFSNAEIGEDPFTLKQIKRFKGLELNFEKWKKKNKITRSIFFHLANSFGIAYYPQSYADKVRLGIGLYGVDQGINQRKKLLPAFSLKSYLIDKKKLPQGYSIGYGRTYRLKRDSWIGTVSAGYADGVPYALGTWDRKRINGSVIIKGERAPIVGKVSMDYLNIDLTDLKHEQIERGTVVTLIGREKSRKGKDQMEEITVEDWSRTKQTHPYDIMTSFNSQRIKKIVSSHG